MILFTVFLFCGAAILLPFFPTFLEVMNRTDLDPLKISNQIMKDPRSVSDYLFWHMANLLNLENLDDLKMKVTVQKPTYLNPSLLAVPAGNVSAFSSEVARLISAGSIELLPNITYLSKVFSMSSIVSGINNRLNEMHALDRLTIASGSKVVWWATGNEVHLQSRVSAPGRIQAKKEIILNSGVYFHLLDAPLIRTEQTLIRSALPQQAISMQRSIEAKNFEIRDGEVFQGDLVVKGDLKIGAAAKILGSLKCHGQLTLGPRSQVYGNIVGLGDINFQGDNIVSGSILCGKKTSFASGCIVGSATQRVTCSSHEMLISGDFQAHGTLRAWKSGVIETS